jgi:processing peptidase subunit alpha
MRAVSKLDQMHLQILVHNRKVSASEMMEKIDSVTPESVRRVAGRLFGPDLGRPATVVCMGTEDVGNWQAIFRKYGLSGS